MGRKVELKVLTPEEFARGIEVLRKQIKMLRRKQMESWKDGFKQTWKGKGNTIDWEKLNQKYEMQIKKRKDTIATMMAKATPAQKKAAGNHTKRNTILGVVGVLAVVLLASNISEANKRSAEESRDYFINIAEEFKFDCEATYNEVTGDIECKDHQIAGEFADYESVELRNNAGEVGEVNGRGLGVSVRAYAAEVPTGNFAVNEDEFTKKYIGVKFAKDEYQTEDYSREKMSEKYNSEVTENFVLYNKVLDREMATKTVKVKWELSEKDLALIDQKNEEWRTAEAEKKAAEEAARAAEEEAKAAEAARAVQAEAERQAAAAAQQRSQAAASGASSGASSSVENVVNDTGGVMEGYCEDETYVRGNPHVGGRANACYGHGGWVINH